MKPTQTTINQYKKVITVDNHDKLRQSLFISLNETQLILLNQVTKLFINHHCIVFFDI